MNGFLKNRSFRMNNFINKRSFRMNAWPILTV